MGRFSRTAIALLVLLLAAPDASLAQSAARIQTPHVASFSRPIECEWRLLPNGWSTNVSRGLWARNTLNHSLPVGARLSWTYVRMGSAHSGELELTAPVGRGGVVQTGAGFSGVTPAQSCQMRVAYDAGRR
jgi:hypothetical protein